MRTTFVHMHVFNDGTTWKNLSPFIWKRTGENQSGEQVEEREREKGSRMCEAVLHKKGSASVINSSVGRISE